MKFVQFFVTLVLSLTLAEETLAAVSAPPKFAELSVAEAEEFFKHIEDGETQCAFIHAAFVAKRLDLVKVAFIYVSQYTRNEVVASPDSPFKEEVLLMMLKADLPYWPDTIRYGSRGLLDEEPYIALIKKYVPNAESTRRLLISKADRLYLVDYIGKARKNIKNEPFSPPPEPQFIVITGDDIPPSDNNPSPQPAEKTPPIYPPALIPSTPAPIPQKAKPPPTAEQVPPSSWRVWPVLVVGAVTLLWLLLRKRK